MSKIAEIKDQILKLETDVYKLEKSKKECTSDMFYWSYMHEIIHTKEKIGKLKTELFYEETIQGLDDVFKVNDSVQQRFKDTLIRIINEHKQFTLK